MTVLRQHSSKSCQLFREKLKFRASVSGRADESSNVQLYTYGAEINQNFANTFGASLASIILSRLKWKVCATAKTTNLIKYWVLKTIFTISDNFNCKQSEEKYASTQRSSPRRISTLFHRTISGRIIPPTNQPAARNAQKTAHFPAVNETTNWFAY